MRKFTFVFMVFISLWGYTQELSVFRGKIVVDSVQMDAIHIINQTQKLGVINDQSGSFEIRANVGDTIIFSSIQYHVKQHIVAREDFNANHFMVKLEVSVNELAQVVLSQHVLTGKIEEDLLKIPTYTENLPFWNAVELKQMGVGTFNDAQSPVQNTVLPDPNLACASIDLELLASSISNIFRKNNSSSSKIEKTIFFDEKMVIELLEIPKTEYYNFIDFMNEQPGIANMLASKDKLKVFEYLINKSKIFREKYIIKK